MHNGVRCVDLGKSFSMSLELIKSASRQRRMSLPEFRGIRLSCGSVRGYTLSSFAGSYCLGSERYSATSSGAFLMVSSLFSFSSFLGK